MTKATKIVHVGLGRWGRNWATNIVPTVPTVETVAWVDTAADALTAAQADLNLPRDRCFQSLAEAFSATDAEAVLAPVTLPAHAPVIEAAASAGKHVLVEKPFARSLEEARRLTALAAEAGITLHVSQNYRFFPAALTVHRLLSEKLLGEVLSVDIEFHRHIENSHYADVPDILLVDMAIHHWDLLRVMVPAEPTEATFWSRNPPGSPFKADAAASGMIRFENGVVATYRGNEVSRYPETPWAGRWQIECERGVIAFQSRNVGPDRILNGEWVTVTRPGEAQKDMPVEDVQHFGRAGTLNAFALTLQGQSNSNSIASTSHDNLGTIALMEAVVSSAHNDGRPTAVKREL